MERDNSGDGRFLTGAGGRRSSRLVAIVGIVIGLGTTLLGFISFVFAITGAGDVLLVGWLSLVWGVAPLVAGVMSLWSLRAATGIAAVPVALGLTLTGYLFWDGDGSGAAVLGGIATVPPAVLLVVCLWTLRGARA